MRCFNVPKPAFVEANLGTRLVVPVSPDITTKDFKGELELTHLNSFLEFGSIKVTALMVKQKSCCYHLSESLPLNSSVLFLAQTVLGFFRLMCISGAIPIKYSLKTESYRS